MKVKRVFYRVGLALRPLVMSIRVAPVELVWFEIHVVRMDVSAYA
jgi:hypothetical protein